MLHDLSFYEDVVGFAKYCATLKMRCDHGCLACDRASEPTRHLRGEVDIKLSAGAQRATVFCEVSKCGDLVTMAFKNDSSPDAAPACAPCTLDLAAQGNLVQRSTIPGSAEDELEVLVLGCKARVLFVGATNGPPPHSVAAVVGRRWRLDHALCWARAGDALAQWEHVFELPAHDGHAPDEARP